MKRASVFLSTEMVDADLRTEAWRDISRPFFEANHIDRDTRTPLEGTLRALVIGPLLIGRTSFNRQQYHRDRRVIVASGLDQYLVQLFLSGSINGDCDGVSFSAGPGDICAFDLARPWRSEVEPGATVSVILSRERVEGAARGRSLHGAVLKSGAPLTRLLADLLTSLDAIAPDLTPDQLLNIEEAVAGLLSSCLAQGRTGPVGDTILAPALRHSILGFIDANLADPTLEPAQLMQRFRLSRAHLYRMFAPDGGVARLIRERRLDAAYRALIAPGGAERSITQIAFAYGFSGSGPFQRAFRGRFGLSPGEARQQGMSPALADQRLLALHDSLATLATRSP